jgi:broad specificity phosphatase PhoE
MFRLLLIAAGPTPWDDEDRLVGSRPLPLTAAGVALVTEQAARMTDGVTRILCPVANEACAQAAAIFAAKFGVKPKNERELEEIGLGLWEGLARQEVHFRFPTVFPQWQEDPLSVVPPDGESLPAVIERAAAVIARLRRRKKPETTLLALRPMIFQVVSGLLCGESAAAIASHLHKLTPLATIDVS